MKREEESPRDAEHLPVIQGRWIPSLGPIGIALLVTVAILTFAAPHVLWLLAYPVLIIAALLALVNAAAFMLRKF